MGDIFSVEGTITTRPEKLVKNGNVPRITCSSTNNGLDDLYKNEATERGHVITVDSATTGFVAYHEYDFIATDHVEKLTLSGHFLSRHMGLFLVTAIRSAIGQKYNYGYKFSQDRIRRQTISLPVDDSGNPDWEFMTEYIMQIEADLLSKYTRNVSALLHRGGGGAILPSLEGRKWSGFRIGDLFTLEQGKCLKSEMVQQDENGDGVTYLGATNRNNAVIGYVKYDDKLIQKGNCIAFIKDGEGSAGYAVYKAEDFIANFHIIAGYAPFLNKYTGIFITTVADMVRGKYSFNYSRNMERLKREVIQLPTDINGNPDWTLITQYMKALESQLLLTWLNTKTTNHPQNACRE